MIKLDIYESLTSAPNTISAIRPSDIGIGILDETFDVSILKPSNITVGTNVHTALETLAANFKSLANFLANKQPQFQNHFSGVAYSATYTSDGTAFDSITPSDDANVYHKTVIKGSGCAKTLNDYYMTFGSILIDVNNNDKDCSFSEIKFIVYDKFTGTIKSINNSKQIVDNDEEQLVVNAYFNAPSKCKVYLGKQAAGSITPAFYKIYGDFMSSTDNRYFGCYCEPGDFYAPNTNSRVAVGIFTNVFIPCNQQDYDNQPNFGLNYYDLNLSVKPEIYSRL